jgi:hypothetical protein
MSPIRMLDSAVINSIARIAPEKFDDLENFRLTHDPTFVFTNDRNFSFRVNTNSKEIKIPTVALEYLWCACYAFYVIYQECCNANQTGVDQFDVNANVRSRTALQLYAWGNSQLHRDSPIEWPNDNPKPASGREGAQEDCLVADELYLCSVAWILHHELAHIRHNHPSESLNEEESRRHEKKADQSATSWVLEGITDEAVLRKRGLGVAIATLVLTAQDMLLGEYKETTHPKSFQRLYDAISSYFMESDHLIYAFSTVICHLHMRIAGIPIFINDNETWKKNFETCLVELSRLTTA